MNMKPISTNSILIIGGGVIGLASAYELAKRNHQVTVLEKKRCGGQATGAAAGMLAPYSEIGEDPDDFFTLCHRSLQLYPEWQQEVKQASGLDFEYVRSGSLHAVFHEADELELETRFEWQKEWGIQAEIVRGKQLKKMEPHLADEIMAAMYYPDEHHLYAPDYVKALQEACLNLGVVIVEETGDVSFAEVESDGVRVTTAHQGNFTADQCVVSSGAWTPFFAEEIGMNIPIFPIRGQICAYPLEERNVNHIIFSSQGYVVSKGNRTLVCGASEDISGYDTSVTEKGINRLMKWSRQLFPFLDSVPPFHRWAGLRPATQDGYPLIGRLSHSPSIIICSGHYRNGILLSPISAKVVGDIVEERQPMINMKLFDPMRFSF